MVRRFLDSGLPDPRILAALPRVVPSLLGRGASLGIASRLNALAFPRKEAVIDRAGTLSWRELDARVNRLSLAYSTLGLSPGDAVAILLRNGREFVEAVLACQRVGMVTAPLNTWARPPELRTGIDQVRPRLLIYDTLHSEQVPDTLPQEVGLVAVGDPGKAVPGSREYEELLDEHPDSPPGPLTRNRGSRQIVIQTSGTTGRPKGAARGASASEIRSFVGLLSIVPYQRDDVVFCPAPMFHSFGLLTLSISTILGATMVLPERFDPEDALRQIEYAGATAASLVPVMIRRIAALSDQVRDRYDLSTLRVVLVSGESLSDDMRRRAREVFGDVLFDLYGSTEAGWVAVATPEDMDAREGTVGRPVPGVQVLVFSPDGERLPAGENGDLHVRSGMVFEGYTSGDSKDEREGALSIGDLGRLDEDGYVYVEGRADEMAVIGGENVYPVEVEQVIQRLPDVQDVAVFAVEDPEYGQALAAFVTGRIDAEEVRRRCREELAGFKVPRKVEVVDDLPRTSTGKVKKHELLDQGGPEKTAHEQKQAPQG